MKLRDTTLATSLKHSALRYQHSVNFDLSSGTESKDPYRGYNLALCVIRSGGLSPSRRTCGLCRRLADQDQDLQRTWGRQLTPRGRPANLRRTRPQYSSRFSRAAAG